MKVLITAVADGQAFNSELSVTVFKGNVSTKEVISDTIDEATKSIAGGDPNSALSTYCVCKLQGRNAVPNFEQICQIEIPSKLENHKRQNDSLPNSR